VSAAAAGAHRLLAGGLKTAATSCGTLVFREAREITAFTNQLNREDKSVRNVAFSILLGAIALLQIAVVSTELSHSDVQAAAVANGERDTRYTVASTEPVRKSPRTF
jgi:hypothetical protein